MPKYRKKLIIIEAEEWTGTDASYQKVTTLAGQLLANNDEEGRLTVPTLEGDMIANEGDYIIKGVKGEIYPCKPDIFKLSYDLVSNNYSILMILLSILTIVLRVYGITHPSYQAFAHVIVGMLLALWFVYGDIYKWLFWLLCIVEVTMAIYTRL